MSLLKVSQLSVEFVQRNRRLLALDQLNFELQPGEILGIIGESGAGKSLTGSAIIGLLDAPGRICGGSIEFNGSRIDHLPARAMQQLRGAKIAAVFQDPLTSLNPLMTVGDQLVETIRTHLPMSKQQAHQYAVQLLQDTGIAAPGERMNHYPHQFSGGMRQRVVIALALAAQPKLIIADEPTTALDVTIQAQIIELLKRVCQQHGAAVILITHDMGVIAQTCDRVAVMYAGRIVEIGRIDQVIGSPSHPYTRGLMAAIPAINKTQPRLNQIPGSMPRLDQLPNGCGFHPRCEKASEQCKTQKPEPVFLEHNSTRQVACWHPIQLTEVRP
jgi:peptide/nickel transport system ATP-binding protein